MTWTDIAPLESLPVDRGVAAVVGDEYVAVFRLAGGELVAIDHIDPFSGMSVMARGLVGSVGGTPTIASPMHKQQFDLRTGRCLEDPTMRVRTWEIGLANGMVRVAA